MSLLKILFFIAGNVFGYYIIDNFFARLNNYLLLSELQFRCEKELIDIQEKEENDKKNIDETPDPVIDNIWVTLVSYTFCGFLFKSLLKVENKLTSLCVYLFRFSIEIVKFFCIRDIIMFLCLTITLFIFASFFLVKCILSLFSSLIFGVHNFGQNLSKAYDLRFYFKKGWLGLIIFILNIEFFKFGFHC